MTADTVAGSPATSFGDPSVTAFRAELREWLAQVAPKYAEQFSFGQQADISLRRAWEDEIVRAGYNCLSWPVEFGGRGLGAR